MLQIHHRDNEFFILAQPTHKIISDHKIMCSSKVAMLSIRLCWTDPTDETSNRPTNSFSLQLIFSPPLVLGGVQVALVPARHKQVLFINTLYHWFFIFFPVALGVVWRTRYIQRVCVQWCWTVFPRDPKSERDQIQDFFDTKSETPTELISNTPNVMTLNIETLW